MSTRNLAPPGVASCAIPIRRRTCSENYSNTSARITCCGARIRSGTAARKILAFRTFEIAAEFQERWDYPALTPQLKRKVFGLNAARVYGVSRETIRRVLHHDRVAQVKADYLNDPDPSFLT
ncbi:MAG: hypothetical protein ACRED0_03050, partial [Gammaproteobacteria bacterium]